MEELSTTHAGWSPARVAAALALMLLGVLVTFDAWAEIYRIATGDEEASQVLLVPVVVVWLIATRWQQVRQSRPSRSMLGPAVIAAGWLISWMGYENALQSFRHGGAVLVVLGGVLTVSGWDTVKRFWPALIVLIFLVPVPGMVRQQIALPLQRATASATQFIFELIGLNVERSGNLLWYNGTEVAVAEACNGMRMVFVLVLVCYAVVFASPLRPAVRALIIVASPICAIACNVIRLVPTVWLYGHYPEKWAPLFHDVSGWAMIGVAFLMVMGLIRLLRWIELPVMQVEAPAPIQTTSMAG